MKGPHTAPQLARRVIPSPARCPGPRPGVRIAARCHLPARPSTSYCVARSRPVGSPRRRRPAPAGPWGVRTFGGRCVIQDFCGPDVLDLPEDPVVVVGSGAAGITLALELADRGHPVVLLESGRDVADPGAIEESSSLNHGRIGG